MSKDETLYERAIRNLKNRKPVVIILIVFVLVISVGQFFTGISNVSRFFKTKTTKIRAIISLQKYDLMAEATEPPNILNPIDGNVKDVCRIAKMIADQLAMTIQPERFLETELQISENILESSHSITAYIHSRGKRQSAFIHILFPPDAL